MKVFSNSDIENYYDQSEVHYRMFWELEKSMGLHYGIWDAGTKSIADAVLNTNQRLQTLGQLYANDYVLDAGCGIGGSAVFNAKATGCRVHGISLSKKQIVTATRLAGQHGLTAKLEFSSRDYTATGFDAGTFTAAWAIESMQTATDKNLFFKEMFRVLQPEGKILIADIFKPKPYPITPEKDMLTMLNGWAMSDMLSVEELYTTATANGFKVSQLVDVSQEISKSVDRIYWASILGMFGTKLYNLFYNASHFSKIHYKTGLAQYKTYKTGKWGYYLVELTKMPE